MHNHMHEELVRLHREDLMAAAQRSLLRAIVRATRPPRWSRRQGSTTTPSDNHRSMMASQLRGRVLLSLR